MSKTRFLTLATLALAIQGCGGSTGGGVEPPLSDAATLGEEIFHDQRLSASGRMSCASCHDPQLGHASPFPTPVAFGGGALDAPGLRLPPSIGYLKFNAAFRIDSDGTPMGGFFWDGRVNTLAEQARKPFLAPNEMANADVSAVIARLADAPYAQRFKAVFGDSILTDPQAAFDRMAYALERYQIEDKAFAPFSSKFDAVNAGKASFTAQELRGLAWFNRADKGNCAACHPSTRPTHAPAALFTDFTYDSLGVPRNSAIAANGNAEFFDMGLCGPVRQDLGARADLCGKFKVPSLRNVALRKRFFHNGSFGDPGKTAAENLMEVVRFYVTRDTQPALWYPAEPYDDLPAALRGNVNVSEAPYNRKSGQSAALSDDEITDLVVFLQTLTDGYKP
ncbi:MAG: cytochrome-c peroxidase [Limnohabitans sp.]